MLLESYLKIFFLSKSKVAKNSKQLRDIPRVFYYIFTIVINTTINQKPSARPVAKTYFSLIFKFFFTVSALTFL